MAEISIPQFIYIFIFFLSFLLFSFLLLLLFPRFWTVHALFYVPPNNILFKSPLANSAETVYAVFIMRTFIVSSPHVRILKNR